MVKSIIKSKYLGDVEADSDGISVGNHYNGVCTVCYMELTKNKVK